MALEERTWSICRKVLDTEYIFNSISHNEMLFRDLLKRLRETNISSHIYHLFIADNSKKVIPKYDTLNFGGKSLLKKSNGKADKKDLISTLAEYTIMTACSHPCVMPVHSLNYECIVDKTDQIKRESSLYYPFMPIGSLADVIQNDKVGIRVLTMKSRIQVVVDVALAIDYFHKHGIFHKHVKPENIFIDHQFHGYLGGTDSKFNNDLVNAQKDYEDLARILYKLLMVKDYDKMNASPDKLEELIKNAKNLNCEEFINYVKAIAEEINTDFNSILSFKDESRSEDRIIDGWEKQLVEHVMDGSKTFFEYFNVLQRRLDILYCFYEMKLEEPEDWENYELYSIFSTVVEDEMKRVESCMQYWDIMKHQTYLWNIVMVQYNNMFGKMISKMIKDRGNNVPANPISIKKDYVFVTFNITEDPVIKGKKDLNSLLYVSTGNEKKMTIYVNPILAYASNINEINYQSLKEIRIKHTRSNIAARVLVGYGTASILEYTRISPGDISADDIEIDKTISGIKPAGTSDLLPLDFFARIYDANGKGFETYMIVPMNHCLPAVGLIPIKNPSHHVDLCYGTSFNSHVAATFSLPGQQIPGAIILKLSLNENGALTHVDGFWFSEKKETIDVQISCHEQKVIIPIRANEILIRMK